MGRTALEVADIFRARGSAWRQAQRAHLSFGQLKVMSAIEQCRSAALGGHVLSADRDKPTVIALREIAAGKVGIEMLLKSES